MTSSIFSCAYWASEDLLWENAYADPSSIFRWIVTELERVLFIVWILVPYQIHDSQVFSPILGLPFQFLDGVL